MFQIVQGLFRPALQLGDPSPEHPVQRSRRDLRRTAVEDRAGLIEIRGVELIQGCVKKIEVLRSFCFELRTHSRGIANALATSVTSNRTSAGAQRFSISRTARGYDQDRRQRLPPPLYRINSFATNGVLESKSHQRVPGDTPRRGSMFHAVATSLKTCLARLSTLLSSRPILLGNTT